MLTIMAHKCVVGRMVTQPHPTLSHRESTIPRACPGRQITTLLTPLVREITPLPHQTSPRITTTLPILKVKEITTSLPTRYDREDVTPPPVHADREVTPRRGWETVEVETGFRRNRSQSPNRRYGRDPARTGRCQGIELGVCWPGNSCRTSMTGTAVRWHSKWTRWVCWCIVKFINFPVPKMLTKSGE